MPNIVRFYREGRPHGVIWAVVLMLVARNFSEFIGSENFMQLLSKERAKWHRLDGPFCVS